MTGTMEILTPSWKSKGLPAQKKTHSIPKTAWKAVLYSASLFWSHLSRIWIDTSDSWREWPLMSWAPAVCTWHESAASSSWYNSRVFRGPLHFAWLGKSLLCVNSSVIPKKGNCRQVKKKQMKKTDGPETLWGRTNFEMPKSKTPSQYCEDLLSIGLPGAPTLQGRWYLSRTMGLVWHHKSAALGCTTPALPKHPMHLGQAHTPLRNAGQPEMWPGWTDKTPAAVKRQWGWEWGIQFSRMPSSARKFLVLTHKKYQLHLPLPFRQAALVSRSLLWSQQSHIQGEDANESWSSLRNVFKWHYHTIVSIWYPSIERRKRTIINVYASIF